MMYSNKMALCLKNNGKVLREQGENVLIPFSSEYSIMLKNLESRKAKVKISIDGEDVLNGSSLLINPNDSIELEGFLSDTIAKNKFHFIEKIQEISDFRGNHIDDGLIRIEFWYEKEKPIVTWQTYTYPNYNDYTYLRGLNLGTPTYKTEITCTTVKGLSDTSSYSVQNCSLSASCCTDSVQTYDSGITVKGSEINQTFQYGSIGQLEEQSHVMVLHLKGYKDNQEKVEKVITVKDKLQCKTCGKVSKSDCKFCPNCGTYLE